MQIRRWHTFDSSATPKPGQRASLAGLRRNGFIDVTGNQVRAAEVFFLTATAVSSPASGASFRECGFPRN